MKNNKAFNNIFDECLERLLRGESIEDCLRSYPEYASELEPLLRTAMSVSKAVDIKPRPVFRAKAREEIHAVFREMEEKRSFSLFGLRSWWATAVATFMAVILLGSGGTVVAASNSMPDAVLYPVKIAVEDVQIALTPSTLGKAKLYAKFADRRVEEMIYTVGINNPQKVELVAQRLDDNLISVANLAGIPFSKEDKLPKAESIPVPRIMLAPPETETQTPPVGAAPRMMKVPETTEAAPAEKQAEPEYHVAQKERTQVTAVAPEKPEADDELPASPKAEPSASVAVGGGTESTKELSPEEKKQVKIIEVLANQTTNNSERLRKALENAPDSVKPILIRAINKSEALYNKAIKNIEEKNIRNVDIEGKMDNSKKPDKKVVDNNAVGGRD